MVGFSVILMTALFTFMWVYFYKNVGGSSPYRVRQKQYHGQSQRFDESPHL